MAEKSTLLPAPDPNSPRGRMEAWLVLNQDFLAWHVRKWTKEIPAILYFPLCKLFKMDIREDGWKFIPYMVRGMTDEDFERMLQAVQGMIDEIRSPVPVMVSEVTMIGGGEVEPPAEQGREGGNPGDERDGEESVDREDDEFSHSPPQDYTLPS